MPQIRQSPLAMDVWALQSVVPAEVAKLALEDGFSPVKAWRLHLKLTQREVAARIGITQAGYWNMENSESPRKASRIKLATALGIAENQLEF